MPASNESRPNTAKRAAKKMRMFPIVSKRMPSHLKTTVLFMKLRLENSDIQKNDWDE